MTKIVTFFKSKIEALDVTISEKYFLINVDGYTKS